MSEYEILLNRFEECDGDVSSSECKSIVMELTKYVDLGGLEGAGLLAEIQALYEPYLDLEQSYVNYFISHALEGYVMKFENQEDNSVVYYGAIGDFRNESMVSEIMDEIGMSKAEELDAKVIDILDEYEPQWRELEIKN